MNGVTVKAFLRGVIATSGAMAQPKGSIPRASNLLLMRRGSLNTADGSQPLYEYQGAIQNNRGKIMASFLFNPLGVARYYLALVKALDQPLGPPKNLSVATAAGGSLAAGTYWYVVTAIDGAGGETTISNEVSIATGANGKNTLTWNTVPNAAGYNIYQSGIFSGNGLERILISTTTPVGPPTFGSLTQSFVDDGTSVVAGSFTVAQLTYNHGYGLFAITSLPPTANPKSLIGQVLPYSGGTPSTLNGNWQITSFISQSSGVTYYTAIPVGFSPPVATATGGILVPAAPPVADTTQQTALYLMPTLIGTTASLPQSYSNSNIVALFPADLQPNPDGGGGGGPGGGGGTGGGGTGGGGSTPSGGVPNTVSFIPQMLEFVNQVVIALGNGFPPQIYSDPNTTDHPATTSQISSITVDANGVVTIVVTGGHGIPTGVNAGANVIVSGIGGGLTNYNGTFPVLQVVNATTLKVRNLAAIGLTGGSGGTLLSTTIPVNSTFVPAFPSWSASTNYSVGSIAAPTTNTNNIYFKAITNGASGATQPSPFTTMTAAQKGQRVYDAGVVWENQGSSSGGAPAPPGAAHIAVYSGALWVFDTFPSNTASGIDGPCSLRMSDINNPNSWNPINQAFLDKDDGTEGAGLSAFTITAQGIAPQGSLVAFKNFSTYQILGLFGAPDFAIQRVQTDMGCTAPRTLQYVPGFGIMRQTHLGYGVFDGVYDRVVSEEVRPYLFPANDSEVTDIAVMDSNWSSVSWSAQTANPPMYVSAIPIGNSGGALTRILCYDLVLKAWAVVDLPFSISTMSQFRTVSANPVTVIGGFNDGALSRWQAGDIAWDIGATGVRSPSAVKWSIGTPVVASNDPDQKLYVRRINIRGVNTNSTAPLTVTLITDGITLPPYVSQVLPRGNFEIEIGVGLTVLQAMATIAGIGDVEIYGWSWGIVPKTAGVPMLVT
jgi:hypothetical protein